MGDDWTGPVVAREPEGLKLMKRFTKASVSNCVFGSVSQKKRVGVFIVQAGQRLEEKVEKDQKNNKLSSARCYHLGYICRNMMCLSPSQL